MIAKRVLQVTNRLRLSIPRSLIQARGGDLRLENKVGEGSAFFFTCPSIR